MQERVIEGFQLSSQQRRAWFLLQNGLAGQSSCVVSIEGPLDIERLRLAIQEMVARNQILRTDYAQVPGVRLALQVVSAQAELGWRVLSLHGVDEAGKMRRVDEVCGERLNGLNTGPALQVTLLVFSDTNYALILSLPAPSTDLWSLRLLTLEIGRIYSGELLDVEPVQYCQYAEWQDQLMEGEEAREAELFWANQEITAGLDLRLPWESRSQRNATFRPASVSFSLDAELSQTLSRTAQLCGASLESALLACWAALVFRLTAQSEFTIATAFNGRNYEGLEGAIGPYSKHVPVVVSIQPTDRLGDLIGRLERKLREVEQWQEYYTWEGVAGEGGLGEIAIGYEYLGEQVEYEADGVIFKLERDYGAGEPIKLKLRCERRRQAIDLRIEYDIGRICSEQVGKMRQQYRLLVAAVAGDEGVEVGSVDIVGEQERSRIVEEWSRGEQEEVSGLRADQMIAKQGAQRPEAIAVECEGAQISYLEMERRANRLANYLRSRSVGVESRVGICLGRTIEMVVAVVGVLKAGAAYVPIEESYPLERKIYMLEDAGVEAVITERGQEVGAGEGVAVIEIDGQWEEIALSSEKEPDVMVDEKNLAYVIYTSGSTGKPKGVGVEHRNLINYIIAIGKRLNLAEGGNYAMVSTFAADLGNTMLFPSLANGGCLHLLTQYLAMDPGSMGDYFDRHDIEYLKITPSHMNALLSASKPERLVPKRSLVLGGEPSWWGLINRLSSLAPKSNIFNHYGPTETTVGAIAGVIKAGGGTETESAPLGNPLSNMSTYILDQYLRLAPIGVVGELYIGGAGASRSYINAPGLTAERFLPDPFSQRPGSRMYMTGDLSRYLPDGNIEFLGRLDRQVKIRGQRVELAEIEAIIGSHPAVRSSVVIATPGVAADKSIVAYVAPDRTQEFTAGKLRSFLKEKLPEHMMPQAIVVLDSLPLTPNGKIDFNALSSPRFESERAYVAPRNAVEQVIADVWKEVLGINVVGVFDNFFDIGGHSLYAMQVASRIHDLFQGQVSIRDIFDSPTCEDLARTVVSNELNPGASEKTAKVLLQVKSMNPDDVLSMLQEKGKAFTR